MQLGKALVVACLFMASLSASAAGFDRPGPGGPGGHGGPGGPGFDRIQTIRLQPGSSMYIDPYAPTQVYCENNGGGNGQTYVVQRSCVCEPLDAGQSWAKNRLSLVVVMSDGRIVKNDLGTYTWVEDCRAAINQNTLCRQ